MIAQDKIEPALGRIEALLAEQCEHGAQSFALQPKGAACGQFVGAPANPQHGLHGTAAALRVLAQSSSSESAALVRRLVWYVQNRDSLYENQHESLIGSHGFEDDQENVIKLSELLYALSFVQTSQTHKDTLVDELAAKLLAASKEDKGWANFTATSDPVDMLPSAFAVIALSRHGTGYEQQISKEIAFLQQNIEKSTATPAQNIDETSVKIYCVFALVFRKDDLPSEEIKRLKHAFVKLWKAHIALFDQDLEQNIEYSRGVTNFYLRIPWQLYLLALAARLDPKRISTFTTQRRLNRILDAVLGTGFRYPYSGSALSSRTNAILFDVLQKIRRFHRGNVFHAAYYAVDRVRTFLSRPLFSYLTLFVSICIAGFCLVAWIRKGGKPEDLGPDLTVALILLFITFFVERLRKPR